MRFMKPVSRQLVSAYGIVLTGLGLLLLTNPAAAFISKPVQLKDVLAETPLIFSAQVEKFDPDRPSVVLAVDEDLKGKVPYRTLPINLTGDRDAKNDKTFGSHTPQLLKRLAVGTPVIVFSFVTAQRPAGAKVENSGFFQERGEHYAFAYTNGTWFQMLGTQTGDDPLQVTWQFRRCEPYLRGTFSGTTAELRQVVIDGLAGKKEPPAHDPKASPGFGPELVQKKAEQKQSFDQKEKRGWGKFVSFKDGTLTLESNAGALLVWNDVGEKARTMKFDAEAGKHLRVESTADALKQVKAGTWVSVGDNRAEIYIGAKKGQVSGTFVSFKNDRLLLLGKDLGDNSFTRKYGNSLQYGRFRDDVPVQESVDGGEYKAIGTANKVLGEVKEGTIVTVHHEGDDNITLIQLGVPKKK